MAEHLISLLVKWSKVVLHLMRTRMNKGELLAIISNVIKTVQLLANGTYYTSTLRADRKHTPALIKTANPKKGETLNQYSYGVMIGTWRDKMKVTFLSTEFENTVASTYDNRGYLRNKPLPIIKYNAHLEGIDRADQLVAYYSCKRKTIRCYETLSI